MLFGDVWLSLSLSFNPYESVMFVYALLRAVIHSSYNLWVCAHGGVAYVCLSCVFVRQESTRMVGKVRIATTQNTKIRRHLACPHSIILLPCFL